MSIATPSAPTSRTPQVREARRPLRADIQALRAFAVAAVIAFHAGVPGLDGGYIGVDVFFVISGFLITGHLLGDDRRGPVRGLLDFYGRRILRLLPVAATVVVATVLLCRWLLPPLEWDDVGTSGRASALYYVNVFLAHRRTDYFSDPSPSPFQHYWSLAVEEQFYVVWPLLLLALLIACRHHRRALAVVVAVATAGSFVWSYHLTGVRQPDAFYLLPSRAWEFGVGALLAIGAPVLAALRGRLAVVTAGLGAATLVAGVVLIGDRTPFPGWVALVPVLGTALVVAGGPRGGLDALGRFAPVAWAGAASYPLYLWHWPLLIVPALPRAVPLGAGPRALLVLATVATAWITHRFLEDPARRSRWLRARAWRPFVLAVALTAVTVATTSLLGRTPALSVDRALPSWPTGATTDQAPTPTVVGTTLTPSLREAFGDKPTTVGTDCFTDVFTAVPTRCDFGEKDADPTLVLFGDSHAQQWLPALDALGKRQHVHVVTFFKGSCPAQLVEVSNDKAGRDYAECTQWRTAALAQIEALAPDVVVAAGYTRQPLADADADVATTWADGTRDLVAALPATARKVVLGDGPHWSSDRPGCLSEHLTHADRCSADVSEVQDAAQRTAIADAAVAAGAEVFDTMTFLCPGGTCPAIMWDVEVYRDDHHVTATFARAVRQAFLPLVPRAASRS